jgi:tetratricopeptide (TPR) repeat protein
MRVWALTLLASSLVLAADVRQLALALKSESDFDRVDLAAKPPIPDAEACIQSQAASLSVSLPEDRAQLFYRKAYCELAEATATNDKHHADAAVADFERAIDVWPLRTKITKHTVPEPVAVALRVFAAVARLNAGVQGPAADAARQELAAALDAPGCTSNVMTVTRCTEVLAKGNEWLGWFALRDNQLDLAVRRFAATPASGWSAWVQGRRDFAAGRYGAAATQYAEAVAQWKPVWQEGKPTLIQSIGPRPQYADALADWGGARLLTGDMQGAIATLDTSLQIESSNARALFLRARAKELAGRKDAALADYNLASRTALASARDLASGDAHLYRGIVLYRNRDFAHAEEEFASALNFEMTGALRPDARAWRHLAAVAGGSCGSSRQSLDVALGTVSPFFPRDEARSLASACGSA